VALDGITAAVLMLGTWTIDFAGNQGGRTLEVMYPRFGDLLSLVAPGADGRFDPLRKRYSGSLRPASSAENFHILKQARG